MSRPQLLGQRVVFRAGDAEQAGEVITVCHGGFRVRCDDGRIRFTFTIREDI